MTTGSAGTEENAASATGESRSKAVVTRREIVLLLVVAACLGASAALSHRLASGRAQVPARDDREALYVSPGAARRMSLGFNGLAADWYWMRSLQYVGGKIVRHEGDVQLDDLSPLGLTQLNALLDQATTLDPKFFAVYEYGAVVLSAVDEEAAVRLVEKGIRENPRDWRLRHHLGYIRWRRGQFREAAQTYAEGAELEGAPHWMRMMSAQMEAEGGSRQTAREIYTRMAETEDDKLRGLALSRLAQVQSLDERDLIRRVLAAYRERAGRCPQAWREVAPVLRSARLRLDGAGAPLDPSDAPYTLDASACDVRLAPESKIPRR